MSATPQGRYRWLIITLLVAAGAYAWYALGQYARLNDLNQRQLSNAGAELKTALDNAVETVEEFNRKWAASAPARKRPSSSDVAAQPRICDFVRSQPYLELRGCAADSPSEPGWSDFRTVQAVTDSTLVIKVSGDKRGSEQRFRYRIEKLLRELAFPDSFALIFVATDKGEVLYQDAPTRRRWLHHLRWGEQRFRDAHADRPPTLQIHNLQHLVGGDAGWQKLHSVTSRTTVALGGTDHQLYLQPLVLKGEKPLTVIIGGAVPRGAVFRDALALGTSLLGILVFLLLFGLLGFPFVKLTCLDLHERFCLWDIKRLYVSAGALLVLFTCASLAIDGYVRWHQEADRGLAPFAEDLEERFLDEVVAIRDQLSAYDEHVKTTRSVRPCDQWGVQTNWFQQQERQGLQWPRNVHLKAVAWIEPRGRQFWKTTSDAVTGKSWVDHRVYFRAVRDGNLFQVDREGPAFFIGPDRSIADGKFYTFISMASRINPARCTESATAWGTPVIAATAQLLSFERQPLPQGYGFALVNREGRVLYHSDGRVSLRENLYEELSEGARVRAMMYAGGRGGLDTRYRERPHRFHLHPIRLSRASDHEPGVRVAASEFAKRDAGFYLAVFRDTSLEQALVGHVFVIGLAGPMGLLLVLVAAGLGILSLVAQRQRHSWSVWLWPHGGLDHIYKKQAVTFLVLLIVSTGIYLQYGTVVPFLLSAVLAPALGILIYRQGVPWERARARLSTPIWQRLSIFLLLVCMVVVPSAALFRVALSHEFAKLILTEREWIEAQREDGLRAARVEAIEERYTEQRAHELRQARNVYQGCVPFPFDALAPPPITGAPVTRQAEVLRSGLAGLQPAPAQPRTALASCPTEDPSGVRSRTSAVLQPIGMGAGLIEVLHWVDSLMPIENEILARQHFREEHGLAYSPEGTLVRRFKASGIALGGFTVTLVLLYWWIRWNTNRLFLADLDASPAAPSGTPEEIWARCEDAEQMVLVQIARERIANPYQRPIVTKLLKKGLVRLDPDVQPYSKEFDDFLRENVPELDAKIEKWRDVQSRRSWRYGRLILGSSVAGLAFFLIASQPGLQSSVIAVATGITGVLTAGSKLRDAVTSWMARKNT